MAEYRGQSEVPKKNVNIPIDFETIFTWFLIIFNYFSIDFSISSKPPPEDHFWRIQAPIYAQK